MMKINNKKTFSLVLTVLLAFSVNSYSQTMSDEAIVQYVTSALAAGRTTSQIGQELISRGVSTAQINRLLGSVSKEGLVPSAQQNQVMKSDQPSQTYRQRSEYSEKSKVLLAGKGTMDEEKDSLKSKKPVPIYGHDLFTSRDLSFEPNENAATPQT